MIQLKIADFQGAKPIGDAWPLEWRQAAQTTARLIIEERVRAEYDRVMGAGTGANLLGVPVVARLGVNHVMEQAIGGFSKGAFFLIVDGVQMTSLDQDVLISDGSESTFLRLLPLKGG